MRQARIRDVYRRLRTQAGEWTVSLQGFSVNDVPSLGTVEIPFNSPVTVLSGPNGVGKTTLLRSLWAALDTEGAASALEEDDKLTAGQANVQLSNGGVELGGTVQFNGGELLALTPPLGVEVMHVDSAASTPSHQNIFRKLGGAEEITNGEGARELNAQELAELNYVLQRDYRSVTLTEVELVDETVPFFEVAFGDDRYDSRTMGSGEIAAFYIWWNFSRSAENTIILLEEPEAFVSSSCQQSIANFVVATTVQKRLCVVISSHSAPLITSMPKESLRFLARGPGGLQVVNDRPPPVLLKTMGIDPPLLGVVLVEDGAGFAFCRSLFERMDPALARRIAIDVRGGDGEIVAALNAVKTMKLPIKFIGAFDPDMVGKIPEAVQNASACLPGDDAIEVMFRNMVAGDPAPLAAATAKEDLPVILAALGGLNHHDWYEEVCKAIGLTKGQLFPMLFNIWIATGANQANAQEAFSALAALLTPEQDA